MAKEIKFLLSGKREKSPEGFKGGGVFARLFSAFLTQCRRAVCGQKVYIKKVIHLVQ